MCYQNRSKWGALQPANWQDSSKSVMFTPILYIALFQFQFLFQPTLLFVSLPANVADLICGAKVAV